MTTRKFVATGDFNYFCLSRRLWSELNIVESLGKKYTPTGVLFMLREDGLVTKKVIVSID